MGLKIEETFRVQAPADRVWAYLIDPQRVVDCLPGAELLEVQADQTFLGQVKVKVGPITTAYKGRARFEEIDETARQVRMTGEGRETAGTGSAKMAMSSQVVEVAEGGAEVRVLAELDVVGRIVQFGRGMIEEVSRQLFVQFADCVRSTLEAAPAAPAGAEPEKGAPPPAGEAGEVRTAEPRTAAGAGTPEARTAAGAGTEAPTGEAPSAAAGGAAAGPTAAGAPAAARPGAKPVKLLPILWAVLRNRIRRIFSRS